MGFDGSFAGTGTAGGSARVEPVELIGPHLRVSAQVDLGRFNRLVDLVNHSRGYVRIHEARLLRRNGEPTPLVVPELFVNQDEITFIAQASAPTTPEPRRDDWAAPGGDIGFYSSASIPRTSRRFVIFTPGHAIIGSMEVYQETTVANFVDSPDPRFVPLTSVTARSLADRRVVSHFDLLLVNRTQMTAVALDAGEKEGAEHGQVFEHLPEDTPPPA
jgi:hypothetical protein